MKTRFKPFEIISYLFFLLYFLSYIGENTNVKYIGIVIFQAYLLLRFTKNNLHNRDRGFSNIINCIFVLLIISLLVNYNPSGMVKTLSLIDLFILTYYMFSKSISKFDVDEKRFITIITNSLLITLLAAFIFFYNDTTISYGRSTSASYRHVFGFGAASIVGFLCFIEFTLSFYLFICRKKGKSSNVLLYVKLMLPLYMAYLADIRASIVAMFFFVLFYLFFKMPRNRTTAIIKIIGVILLTFLSIVYLSFASMDSNRLDYILSHRFYYYERAISDIIDNHAVVFGVGSFRNSGVFDLGRLQIDNAFLDVFYQYGIISMFLFMILAIKIGAELYKVNIKWTYKSEQENKYRIFINAYFASVLVYSMVEKNLFSISSALSIVTFLLVFWFLEKYRAQKSTLGNSST